MVQIRELLFLMQTLEKCADSGARGDGWATGPRRPTDDARLWGEGEARREHWSALARADAYPRLDETRLD